VCLVRDLQRAESLFPTKAPNFVVGSLQDQKAVRACCADVDIIYHSAGLTKALSRKDFFAVNATATRQLLDTAAETAPDLERFVYISSQAASGPSKLGQPKTEDDAAVSVSDYGASKLAGEHEVEKSGLPWTVMRPCAVYGPGDKAFLTVFKIVRRGFMPVVGNPRQELSMVHIADLVDALLEAQKPETVGQTYFVCHPEVLRANDLCKHIGAAVSPLKKKAPTVVGLPAWFAKGLLTVIGTAARLAGQTTFLSADKSNEYLAEAWVCSPAKLASATGWNAKIDYREGARQTADWYRENGWL